ncbi:MAG: SUMF1/EgtB/PvdO family nonheme iron enzyme [Deltaproteobacteria bacterium]|nr:SUMF1/EgtB/PvdO family nonheme iron enzyme [Deltaproteobacteria bacterium]
MPAEDQSAPADALDSSALDSGAIDSDGPDFDATKDQSGADSTPAAADGTDGTANGDVLVVPAGQVLVPAGSFWMGCVTGDAACKANEKPAHKLQMSAFFLDKTEVTVAAYAACVAAGACKIITDAECDVGATTYGVAGKDQHPVTCVPWNQADAFCTWAQRRLPTEAEWERAARAGLENLVSPWGNEWPPTGGAGNLLDDATVAANPSWTGIPGYNDGFAETAPVGSFPANAYGLYDMAGNAAEWVSDWYGSTYYGKTPPADPPGPSSGSSRLTRGSNWGIGDSDHRTSSRVVMAPAKSSGAVGFRCGRSL